MVIIFCITISSVLLVSVAILFSSLREYMIDNVKTELGDYHVIIKGEFIKSNLILNNYYKDGRNYIKYGEIKRVYKNTEKICKKNKCDVITYNDSLLSLYGLSKSSNVLKTFKSFLYFFVCFFGIIVFLILYNSFSIVISIKRNNIILYKYIGSDDTYIFKLFFKDSLIMGLFSIVLGIFISIFLNFILIGFINKFLYEIFNGKLHLSIYFSFIIIPILFMFLIIIICSLLPFYKIRKCKAIEMFRNNNEIINSNIRLEKNIIFYLFKINIYRFKNKYRNLIICVFLFCFSFNVICLFLDYTSKCIHDFIIIPKYDLSVSVSGEYDFKNIIKKFKATKKNEFHSCGVNAEIPVSYYNKYEKSNVIVTDLGGNEIINDIEVIGKKNNKISYLKYKRFKKIGSLSINNHIFDNLKLTNKKIFGIDGKDTVINLNEDEFKIVCPEFNSNLAIKSNYNGFDKYLNKLIKNNKLNMNYSNVKKANEIINNLVLVFKLLFYCCAFLILLTLFSVAINTSIFSVYKRRVEFVSLRNLGVSFKDIVMCLFLESLFVSFTGFLLSISFIFIVNKYLYMAIKEVFDINKIIINYEGFFISFSFCFILIFVSLFITYKLMNKNSVSIIKSNSFM